MNRVLPVIILAILLAPSSTTWAQDLPTLGEWMTGSFDSGAQAMEDSSYYDIRLEMVRVWPGREDGIWLYVEQAVAGHTEKPYRQRVYRLSQVEGDLFKSEVYVMEDPLQYAGQWHTGHPLGELTPEDLQLRPGCAVFLRWDPSGEYVGATIGRGCASSMRGAAWASSRVMVGPARIESWDQGFDDEGQQVWGAENGPYVFLTRK